MKKKKLNLKLSNKEKIQGRWWKISYKIEKTIQAKYDKIRDWVIDPKGYFLIKIDKNKKILRVGYCKFNDINQKKSHEMKYEIRGKTAIEIVNTLIRKKFISSLQHAADMGIELNKAEIALKYNLNYIQDKDLIIPIIKKKKKLLS